MDDTVALCVTEKELVAQPFKANAAIGALRALVAQAYFCP